MEKAKKNRIKKYISWVCMVAVVVMLAAMPLLAGSNQEVTGPQASILSGTVKTGSIHMSLFGGGTLSSEKPAEITLPEGVKIKEFLVSNGDLVKEGDPLAVIDRVSVMEAITGVQETMDYLLQEMGELSSPQATEQLTAKAGGLVKQVFAQKGDDVQSVMLEHGALAVLSLDSMMEVKLSVTTPLSTGDSVSVHFEDGSKIPGWVDSNMDGILVVTVEDDGYSVGMPVIVTDTNDSAIGAGTLEVHNAWRVVAYSGTVENVSITPESNTYAGQPLFTIKADGSNPQREALASQHRDYEKLMMKLFQLYQSETIPAPCDGMVSGVDENSIHLLSGYNDSLTFDFLANAPGNDPDVIYDNVVGQLEMVLGNYWIVRINPQSQPITDYKEDASTLDMSTENMHLQTMLEPVTVYRLVDGQWEIAQPQSGDILAFAMDDRGFVWAVYLGTEELQLPEPEEDTPSTEEPDDSETPTLPEGWEEIEIPENWEDLELPEGWEDMELPENWEDLLPDSTPDFQLPTMGGSLSGILGGFGGMYPQAPEYELYSLEESLLMNVIPQNEMILTIQLDERDISKAQVGMQAEVTVEALPGETFPAVITKVGDTGLNLGGSSRFTVELTLPIQTNMLTGMTATATIPLYTNQDIPLIPVEALVEEGSKTLVYTGYDEKNDQLINPVEITLGCSDGIHAEVLSGLSVEDTFWYSYYDTLEIDYSVEDPVFGFG